MSKPSITCHDSKDDIPERGEGTFETRPNMISWFGDAAQSLQHRH